MVLKVEWFFYISQIDNTTKESFKINPLKNAIINLLKCPNQFFLKKIQEQIFWNK